MNCSCRCMACRISSIFCSSCPVMWFRSRARSPTSSWVVILARQDRSPAVIFRSTRESSRRGPVIHRLSTQDMAALNTTTAA